MLAKNIISSIITQVPLFLLGIFTGVLSTRILGDEGKGIYTIFQANAQLFVLIFLLGIDTGIVYYVSSKKEKESKVLGMSILLFFISSTILLVCIIFLNIFNLSYIYIPKGYDSFFYSAILFLLFFFSFFNSIISSFIRAHSLFGIVNKVSILNSIINLFLFGFAFIYTNIINTETTRSFDIILLITLVSLIVNTFVWLVIYTKKISQKPDFNIKVRKNLKRFILYNFSVYIGVLINFFNYRLDLWIVNYYSNKKDLSYYSLSTNIIQIILYVSVAIASVLLPYLSNKSESKRIELFKKISKYSSLLFILIVIAGFILSPYLIPYLYGNDFINSVTPFQLLIPGILFSCITQVFSIFILSSNKNFYNIIACTIGLVFTVFLDILFIKNFGINGAAIATSISYFVIFLASYFFIQKIGSGSMINLFIVNRKDISFLLNKIRQFEIFKIK